MADLTLEELFDVRRQFLRVSFQAYQGQDFSPKTVVKSINRSKRKIEEALHFYKPAVTLHLHTGTDDYDFENAGSDTSANDIAQPVWLPQHIYINLRQLYGADREAGFWKPMEFRAKIPDWFDTSTHGNDIPEFAVFYHIRQVKIWKPASASAVSTGGNYAAGFVRSLDFTITAPPGDADDLAQTLTLVPLKLQEEVGILSAIQDAHPNLGEREQWALFKDIRGDAWEQITEQGRANRDQIMNANNVFQAQYNMIESVRGYGF